MELVRESIVSYKIIFDQRQRQDNSRVLFVLYRIVCALCLSFALSFSGRGDAAVSRGTREWFNRRLIERKLRRKRI